MIDDTFKRLSRHVSDLTGIVSKVTPAAGWKASPIVLAAHCRPLAAAKAEGFPPNSRLLFHHTFNGYPEVSRDFRDPIARVFRTEGIASPRPRSCNALRTVLKDVSIGPSTSTAGRRRRLYHQMPTASLSNNSAPAVPAIDNRDRPQLRLHRDLYVELHRLA